MLCVGALGIMVLVMYYTYNTPSVSGEPTGLWSFVVYFLREFIFLAFVVIVFAITLVAWILRKIRQAFVQGPFK